MNERELHPRAQEAIEADGAWDIDAIGQRLNTTPQEVWSLEDGPGWSFPLGEQRQTTLALHTADLSLRFHPSDQPTLHPADIIFRQTDGQQTTELSLINQGEVTLWLTPINQLQKALQALLVHQ